MFEVKQSFASGYKLNSSTRNLTPYWFASKHKQKFINTAKICRGGKTNITGVCLREDTKRGFDTLRRSE